MPLWTFLDYVDEAGRNVIAEWAKRLPARARVKFHTRLQYMAPLPRDQWASGWSKSLVGKDWRDIYEIRFFVDKVQWRPLYCFGPEPGEITILGGAHEKGGKLEPDAPPKTCQDRRAEIGRKETKHVTPHDFSA